MPAKADKNGQKLSAAGGTEKDKKANRQEKKRQKPIAKGVKPNTAAVGGDKLKKGGNAACGGKKTNTKPRNKPRTATNSKKQRPANRNRAGEKHSLNR